MKNIQKNIGILVIVLVVGIFATARVTQADTEVGKTVLPPSTLPALVNSTGDVGNQGTVDTSTSAFTQRGGNGGGSGSDMISGLMDQMSKAIANSLPKGSIPATNCSPAGPPGFPTFGRDGTACSVPVSVGAVGGVCQSGQCRAVSFTTGQDAMQSFKDKFFKEVGVDLAKKLLGSLFNGGGGGGSYPDNYTAPADTPSGGFNTFDTTGLGTNTGLDSIFTDSSSTSLTYTPLSLATGRQNISPKVNVVTYVNPAMLNTTHQTQSSTGGPGSITGNGVSNPRTTQGMERIPSYRRINNPRTQITSPGAQNTSNSNTSRNGTTVTLSELTAGSIEAQRRAALLNEHAGAESLNNLRDYRSSNIVDRTSNAGNDTQPQKSTPSFWERILQMIGGVFGLR